MSKKQVAILWGFQIILYITNIVLIIITGGTLTNSILGWLLASILAGLIIYLCFRLIDKQKTIDEINKEWLKSIKDWKELIEKERKEKEIFKKEFERLSIDKIVCAGLDLADIKDTTITQQTTFKNAKELVQEIEKAKQKIQN